MTPDNTALPDGFQCQDCASFAACVDERTDTAWSWCETHCYYSPSRFAVSLRWAQYTQAKARRAADGWRELAADHRAMTARLQKVETDLTIGRMNRGFADKIIWDCRETLGVSESAPASALLEAVRAARQCREQLEKEKQHMKYGYTTETIEKPIDPGEGFDLLPIDGIVSGICEGTDDGEHWWPVDGWMCGKRLQELLCREIKPFHGVRYPKPAPPEPRYGHDAAGNEIEPPEGWEIVPEEEVIPEPHQFTLDGRAWYLGGDKTYRQAQTMQWLPDDPLTHYLAFARRKQPAVSPFAQDVAAELARAREKHMDPHDAQVGMFQILMRLTKFVAAENNAQRHHRLVLAAMAQRFDEEVPGKPK